MAEDDQPDSGSQSQDGQEDLSAPTLIMAVAAQLQSGEVGTGTQTAATYAEAFRNMLYDCFGEEPATGEKGREVARKPLDDHATVASTIVGLSAGYAKSQVDEGVLTEEAFMEVVKVGLYLALNFDSYLRATDQLES